MMIFIIFIVVLCLSDGVQLGYPKQSYVNNLTAEIDYTTSPATKSTEESCCPCSTEKTKEKETTPKPFVSENKMNRLPDFLWPIEYRLSLKVDFNELKFFLTTKVFGNVSIDFTIINATDAVELHCSENMFINHITVKSVDSEETGNLTKNYTVINSTILKINLISNLSVNGNYTVEINFDSVHMFNQESGILSRKYQNTKGTVEHMLATQFQPESARSVFPCFDEPRFKTSFQLTLTTNSEYSILSNMPETLCQNMTDSKPSSWKTCHFEKSPPMPVYNLAFAVIDFKYIERIDSKNRRFRIWARESEVDKASFALNTTIEAFKLFEESLQIDFPLKKVDSLAIPNLKGFLGMEHYGLITYDEPVIIWNENFPLSFSKVLCVSIICHEVAHQWFGNLVTTAMWKNLWLNEGFATFYSYLMTKEILKDETFFLLEKLSVFNYVRNFDDYFALVKSTVSAPIVSVVEAKFDYLSYKKGFIIVSMLEKLLGSQQFKLAIKEYLRTEQDNSVLPSNLWNVFNDFSKLPFQSIMREWLNKVCYPIVNVRVNTTSSEITLKQNASINFKTTKFRIRSPDFTTEQWKIPLHIIHGNSTFRSVSQLSIFEKPFDLLDIKMFNYSDDWLIINFQSNSFFTTDYDDVLFDRVMQQMLNNHSLIPPLNRAQIMQDFFDLSKKYQRSDLEKLLKLFTYLPKESNPVPLFTAISLFDKLNGLFQLRSFYPVWRQYATKVFKPSFKRLVNDFLNNFQGKKPTHVSLRRSLLNLACKLKLKYCNTITNILIERWKNNTLLKTDYDLLHIALCRYVEKDDQEQSWYDIYNSNQFQSWDYINTKYYAMGCSRVPWIIEKNMDIAYNVLKNLSQRIDFPHVSSINIDSFPPDFLHGTTSMSNLLMLSFAYNVPNSLNFLFRFKKDGLNLIYNFLQYPPHFPLPNSLVEYAVSTLSHYNYILYLFNQTDKSRNVILKDAKANIDWILNNGDLEKLILNNL